MPEAFSKGDENFCVRSILESFHLFRKMKTWKVPGVEARIEREQGGHQIDNSCANCLKIQTIRLIICLDSMKYLVFLLLFIQNLSQSQTLEQVVLYKKFGVKTVKIKDRGVASRLKIEATSTFLKIQNNQRDSERRYFFNQNGGIDSIQSFSTGKIHHLQKNEFDTLGRMIQAELNNTNQSSGNTFFSRKFYKYCSNGALDSVITKNFPKENHPSPDLLNNQKFSKIVEQNYDENGVLISKITSDNLYDLGIHQFKNVFFFDGKKRILKSVQLPSQYAEKLSKDSFRLIHREVHFYKNGLIKKEKMYFSNLFGKKTSRKATTEKYKYSF